MSHMTDHSQSSATGWQEENALWYLGGQRIIQALETQMQHIGLIFEYQEPTGTITSSYAPSQEDIAFYVIEGEARFVAGKQPSTQRQERSCSCHALSAFTPS